MSRVGKGPPETADSRSLPSSKVSAKGHGHTYSGRDPSKVTGLRAGNMGHKPQGRSPAAITGLRAGGMGTKVIGSGK